MGEKFCVAVAYSGPGAPFGSAGVQRKTSRPRMARLANDDAIRLVGEPLPHCQSPTKMRFSTVNTTMPRPTTWRPSIRICTTAAATATPSPRARPSPAAAASFDQESSAVAKTVGNVFIAKKTRRAMSGMTMTV